MKSLYQAEGYSDSYNFDLDKLKLVDKVISGRKYLGQENSDKTKRVYEFLFVPNSGFLNSNDPLLNNCELKLSFDRSPNSIAFIAPYGDKGIDDIVEIKDCYAMTEYISSEALRKHFSKIQLSPIIYQYEEIEVTYKNLPLNELNIRLDNIKGGNNPICLFMGIVQTEALSGASELSTTNFRQHGVRSVNLTLNGNSVNGFPVEIRNNSPVIPMYLFNSVTNRFYNSNAGEGYDIGHFKSNWLYSHFFESEHTSQGWLGVTLGLEEPYEESHTLVLITSSSAALSIDKFHQIEKLVL